jgi:hypothetical protein
MAEQYTHRNVGNVTKEVAKGETRIMLAPGDFIALAPDDLKDDGNKHLVDDGYLLTLKDVK